MVTCDIFEAFDAVDWPASLTLISLFYIKVPGPYDLGDVSVKGDLIDTGYLSGQRSSLQVLIEFETPLSEYFYQDKDLMNRLKNEGFDLLFSDMVYIFTR